MPVEVYRIQNNDQTVQRKNIVVSVTETAPIILSTTLGKREDAEISTEPLEIVVTPDRSV